ncbi:hypothetical protein, partial [Yersinia enterocolitica]
PFYSYYFRDGNITQPPNTIQQVNWKQKVKFDFLLFQWLLFDAKKAKTRTAAGHNSLPKNDKGTT